MACLEPHPGFYRLCPLNFWQKVSSAPSSFTTDVMLKQAFSEMDRDNDGRVTEDEFVSATLGHEKVATLLTMKIVNCLVQP